MIEQDKRAEYTQELWKRWLDARKEWEKPKKKYNWVTGARY